MQTSKGSHLIIPNIFPAKLWHLVNHSEVTAIVWDSKGEGIKIHQELLEKQILSPNTSTLNCCNNFRGITFSSFIRQLYAYGFKKVEHCKRYQTEIHYYFHPHFNKNKPELLSLMCRSAPKYRRTVPFFPERETLPEKANEKLVHGRGDNHTEANGNRSEYDFQTHEPQLNSRIVCSNDLFMTYLTQIAHIRFSPSVGNILYHYPFKPIPLAHMVTGVQPQFSRRNVAGGPPHMSSMLQVPGANYHTAIVPTNSSLMHPFYFQQGNPNVFPHPDCFVHGEHTLNFVPALVSEKHRIRALKDNFDLTTNDFLFLS